MSQYSTLLGNTVDYKVSQITVQDRDTGIYQPQLYDHVTSLVHI